MKRRFYRLKEILNRITGIETPLFGISWEPNRLESETFARLLTHLEDKRVLFGLYENEAQSAVQRSVNQIRQLLTEHLTTISNRNSILSRHLREMRKACQEYLDYSEYISQVNTQDGNYGYPNGEYTRRMYLLYAQGLFAALGMFRQKFLKHLWYLIEHFGIEIDSELQRLDPNYEVGDTLAVTGKITVFTHRNSPLQSSYSLEPTLLLTQLYPDGSNNWKIWLLETLDPYPLESDLWRPLYDSYNKNVTVTAIGKPSHDFEKLIVREIVSHDSNDLPNDISDDLLKLKDETDIFLDALFKIRKPPNRA